MRVLDECFEELPRNVASNSARDNSRLQTYYLDWRTLYSHVLVLDEDRAGRFRRLPIMRYLNGPRWYYLAPRAGHELGLVQGARWSQWVAFMALPVCSLTAAGLLLVLLASGKRNRGR